MSDNDNGYRCGYFLPHFRTHQGKIYFRIWYRDRPDLWRISPAMDCWELTIIKNGTIRPIPGVAIEFKDSLLYKAIDETKIPQWAQNEFETFITEQKDVFRDGMRLLFINILLRQSDGCF